MNTLKINIHILKRYSPPERLCVDEIFSRWYALGGDWTNLSLTHYVQMGLKPDSGCKIHDTCCGSRMVLVNLKCVNSNTKDEASSSENGIAPAGDVNHGTKILKNLVYTWVGKRNRVVAEDSYFAIMKYEKSLVEMGLVFITVVD